MSWKVELLWEDENTTWIEQCPGFASKSEAMAYARGQEWISDHEMWFRAHVIDWNIVDISGNIREPRCAPTQ